jgi:hypothetical protein
MIVFACPKCLCWCSMADQFAGYVSKCPQCGQHMRVPSNAVRPQGTQPSPSERSAATPPPLPSNACEEYRHENVDELYVGRHVWDSHIDAMSDQLRKGETLLAIITGRAKAVSPIKVADWTSWFSACGPEANKGGDFLSHFLAVTSCRVVIWARGIFKCSTDSFEFADIQNVEIERALIGGAINLHVYGRTERFAAIPKNDVEPVGKLIRRKVQSGKRRKSAHVAENDEVAQLEKLADLLEKGLITRSEFEVQKRRILD